MYLICGEALYDFFTRDNADQTARTINFTATAGGSPFNLAVGIRRLGAPVALCASISNDPLGMRLRGFLRDEKVAQNFIIQSRLPTPISLAQTDDNGNAHYAFYGVGGADTAITEHDLADLAHDLSAITAIHFGSYSSVLPPVADAFANLVRRAGDKFLAFDPNVRANIESEMAIWRARFDEYVNAVDYIKLSGDDFVELFGGQSPDECAKRWLANPRLQLVILTDQARAIRVWHKNYQFETPAVVPKKMVDSVAAGDSFQAAMLMQFDAADKRSQVAEMDENTLREKVHFAARCAAQTCAKRGADLPTLAAMRE